jgi:hypothetical protein
MTVPDWLKTRDGALAPGIRDTVLLVTLSGHPQYRLDALPAKGKYTCAVVQTNNGRRLDDGIGYPTSGAALAGGLEELRTKLGW